MYHDLGVFRIELRSDALHDLLSYYVLRYRVTVAPVGSHGIICVRNSDDTCELRYILTFESFRISSSVVTLMMIARTDLEPR